MFRRLTTALMLMIAAIYTLSGCSKESDNDVVECWRGNYTYYGFNIDGEYVELTESLIILFEGNYNVTKQSLIYDSSTLIEAESTVKYGKYSRTENKLILLFDDCECTTPCLCTHSDYNTERYYYKYTYYEDEEYDEDEDDEAEDNSYGTLDIRLIDDDDPYTEWISLRYLEWAD